MNIPFLNLTAHHAPIREELDRAIAEVIDCGAFAGGRFVDEFEAQFAEFCQARYAIGVGSGTEALWLALAAEGVGPGDEVITATNSFFATAEAISFAGATPVFVDVDDVYYHLNVAAAEKAITPRTKAIIPVQLFGQTADMDPIRELAAAHGLAVIEDAAQSHGAEYKGVRSGNLGNSACFSFYPGKNLGALGEAGAVVTNDEERCETMRMLRDHGQSKKYHHKLVGWNCRMDGVQGAALSVKLRHLEANNAKRRAHAALYSELLAGHEAITLPACREACVHVYHIYSVRVANRDAVMQALQERGVGCGIHYPVPIHRQEAYAHLGLSEGTLPVAEQCAEEFLSLPMFPELTPDEVAYAAGSLIEAVECTARA